MYHLEFHMLNVAGQSERSRETSMSEQPLSSHSSWPIHASPASKNGFTPSASPSRFSMDTQPLWSSRGCCPFETVKMLNTLKATRVVDLISKDLHKTERVHFSGSLGTTVGPERHTLRPYRCVLGVGGVMALMEGVGVVRPFQYFSSAKRRALALES